MNIEKIEVTQNLVNNKNYILEVREKLKEDEKNKKYIEYLLRNTRYKNICFCNLPIDAIGKALIFASINVDMEGKVKSEIYGDLILRDIKRDNRPDEELLHTIEKITLKYN